MKLTQLGSVLLLACEDELALHGAGGGGLAESCTPPPRHPTLTTPHFLTSPSLNHYLIDTQLLFYSLLIKTH